MPFPEAAFCLLCIGAAAIGVQAESITEPRPDASTIQAMGTQKTAPSIAPNSQETSQNAVYVHPLVIAISSLVSDLALAVPLTYEREFGGHFSLVARPTLYIGSFRSDSSSPLLHLTGFEGIVGIRNYLNGRNSTGAYQGIAIGWVSVQTSRSVAFPGQNDAVATRNGVELLMSLGYRAKWSWFTLFADAGVGGSYSKAGGNLGTLDHFIVKNRSRGAFPVAEANIGLGYPF